MNIYSTGLWVLAVIVAVGAGGEALARPDTRSMTCDEAHDLVFKEGSVVMNTSDTTYLKFVRSRRFCARDEIARNERAPTSDDPKCAIGYICRPRQRNDD